MMVQHVPIPTPPSPKPISISPDISPPSSPEPAPTFRKEPPPKPVPLVKGKPAPKSPRDKKHGDSCPNIKSPKKQSPAVGLTASQRLSMMGKMPGQKKKNISPKAKQISPKAKQISSKAKPEKLPSKYSPLYQQHKKVLKFRATSRAPNTKKGELIIDKEMQANLWSNIPSHISKAKRKEQIIQNKMENIMMCRAKLPSYNDPKPSSSSQQSDDAPELNLKITSTMSLANIGLEHVMGEKRQSTEGDAQHGVASEEDESSSGKEKPVIVDLIPANMAEEDETK